MATALSGVEYLSCIHDAYDRLRLSCREPRNGVLSPQSRFPFGHLATLAVSESGSDGPGGLSFSSLLASLENRTYMAPRAYSAAVFSNLTILFGLDPSRGSTRLDVMIGQFG